jgi:hypothetical protein
MRVTRIVAAVLALLVFAAPAAAADDRGGGGARHPSVVPADHVAGNSGGRLLGDWFSANFSLPADQSPFGNSANLCLDIGRHGRVLAPAGGLQDANRVIEMTCGVEVGRPVVLVMTSVDCSTAEVGTEFYARTAAEQRACAVDFLKSYDVRSINVSIDDGRSKDIHRNRFFEVSPQQHVVLPENPVYGAAPGPATFVAAAWMAEVRGLRKGDHTVKVLTPIGNADGSTSTYTFIVHLHVVGRGK